MIFLAYLRFLNFVIEAEGGWNNVNCTSERVFKFLFSTNFLPIFLKRMNIKVYRGKGCCGIFFRFFVLKRDFKNFRSRDSYDTPSWPENSKEISEVFYTFQNSFNLFKMVTIRPPPAEKLLWNYLVGKRYFIKSWKMVFRD